jgi:hypothetical protein
VIQKLSWLAVWLRLYLLYKIEVVMSDRDSAHERLTKTIQQAPSREWIEQYLDLVKEVIEFAQLDNDDPRLVLSLTPRRNLPVTINGRYVLSGFRKHKPLVGFIFPHNYRNLSELAKYAFPPEFSSHQYKPIAGEIAEQAPYFFEFEGLPKRLLTVEHETAWKEAVLFEAQRYQSSPYRKHHELLFYEAAINIDYRTSLLNEIFSSQLQTYKKPSKCKINQLPSVDEYVAGLKKIKNKNRVTNLQIELLRQQYYAPHRSVTAPALAKLVNASSHSVVNSMYGKLGHTFCDETGLEAAKAGDGIVRWWTVWSLGYQTNEGFLWEMHLEVAKALEELGWVVQINFQTQLQSQRQKVEAEGYFNIQNLEDARQRVTTSIVQRQGQSEFRQKLLNAYDRKCAITDCDVETAIEAAHIIPYQGTTTNHPANGLPLRADVHTLFDLHLISINPNSYEVIISPELVGTCYQQLSQKKLKMPKFEIAIPSQEALRKHYEEFLRKCKSVKLSDS